MMGAIPIPALFFHYSVVLSDSQNRYRHWIQLAYVLSGAFMASNLFGYIVARVEPRGSFAFWPVPGFLLPYQLVFFGTTVVVFLYVLYCGCREATGVRREQIRYVFIGALLSFGGGLTNYFWWFNVPVDPWGNFLVFLGDAIIAYGLLRYRLMDISLAVRNVITYAFFVLTVAVPIALLVGWYGSVKWAVTGILVTGVVTPFIFGHLKEDVMRIIDRLPPFRKKFSPFHSLGNFIASLQRGSNVEDWAWRLVGVGRDLYGAKSANVLVWEEKEKAFLIKAGFGLNLGKMRMLSIPGESRLVKEMEKGHVPLVADLASQYFSNSDRTEVEEDLAFMQSSLCVPLFYQSKLWALFNMDSKETGEFFNDLDLSSLNDLVTAAEQQLQVILSGLNHSQISSLWAHDLVRPLGAKGSFCLVVKLLDETPMSEKTRMALKVLKEDVQFLRENLKHVLRPTVKEAPEINPVFVKSIFHQVALRFKPWADGKPLSLKVIAPPSDQVILCDKKMLEHRVLGNLLENALRHTPKGGSVTVGYRIEGNTFVGFVQDTGPGIKKEDLSALFTPGVQLDPKNKGQAGLGLASVKSVIEAHGGRVWVESEVGKGTAFFYSLHCHERID